MYIHMYIYIYTHSYKAGPPSYRLNWFINPVNYRHKYHKLHLLEFYVHQLRYLGGPTLSGV